MNSLDILLKSKIVFSSFKNTAMNFNACTLENEKYFYSWYYDFFKGKKFINVWQKWSAVCCLIWKLRSSKVGFLKSPDFCGLISNSIPCTLQIIVISAHHRLGGRCKILGVPLTFVVAHSSCNIEIWGCYSENYCAIAPLFPTAQHQNSKRAKRTTETKKTKWLKMAKRLKC